MHYLIMANQMLVQKALLEQLKDTGLTIGQPKILDYLKDHVCSYTVIIFVYMACGGYFEHYESRMWSICTGAYYSASCNVHTAEWYTK